VELCRSAPKRIGSDDVDGELRCETCQRVADARQKFTIHSQSAIVIQNKVRKAKLAEAGNVDFDHK
jgi:hypothetical protein